MGAHSGILAWRIPWTEKPGRIQRGRKETRLSDLTHSLPLTSFKAMVMLDVET